MTKLLWRVIGLLLLTFPQITFAQNATDIHEFAMKFIEAEKAAWERGDLTALQAMEHPDVVYQNIDGNVFRGWEGHRKDIEDAKASFNGAPITQEWKYLMGEGNIFAVSYVWDIHFPGQILKITGIAVCRVRDGKLVEEWGAGYELPSKGSQEMNK